MLWGAAAGTWLTGRGSNYLSWHLPGLLTPVAVLGRWSLSYYVVHQPVMMGILMAVIWLGK